MAQIDWNDFEKVEMRVGKIVSAEAFPEAHNPSYLLQLDFGDELGRRQSAAALAQDYELLELEGRLVVAVTNFPPKQIANHVSQVLVLAAVQADGSLRLLQPDADSELGALIR